MPSAISTVREHRLDFQGYGYVCRVVEGAGPVTQPIVVLGGSSQDRFSWTRYERWLLPHASLVTVDLPGYGEADPLPVRHGFDFLAAAVRRVLDTLGAGRVNLMGACFGASIALRCAQLFPDRVARLLLGGTGLEVPSWFRQVIPRLGALMSQGRLEEAADDLVALFMAPPGTGCVRRRAAVTRLLRRQMTRLTPRQVAMVLTHNERLLRHSWVRPGPGLTAPALVFTGEHDTLACPGFGRDVAARLGCPFVTVREADHLASVERDEEVADLMLRFFTDRPVAGLPYLSPPEHPAAARPTGPVPAAS